MDREEDRLSVASGDKSVSARDESNGSMGLLGGTRARELAFVERMSRLNTMKSIYDSHADMATMWFLSRKNDERHFRVDFSAEWTERQGKFVRAEGLQSTLEINIW